MQDWVEASNRDQHYQHCLSAGNVMLQEVLPKQDMPSLLLICPNVHFQDRG